MPDEFHVVPRAVRDFAQHIASCRDDADDGIAYLNRHGNLSWEQLGATNFLGGLKGAHDSVMAALNERFTHLKDVLEQSASELERTATYYEVTDTTVARDFDRELPDPGRPVWPAET
ncbi:MAG: WXG100 family type VII secretion target [Micromonosporaceae bacterium]|jgi:uncharacterized protein YukE